MVNYLRNMLASGIVTAIMTIAPGCGDVNNVNIYNYDRDAKQESSDVRVDTQIKDGYHTADLKTEVLEDLFTAEDLFTVGDNLDLKDAHDTNVDSNVEDLLTTEVNADLKDAYVTEVSDVEDTYTTEVNADVEDVFEISADVEDSYTAEVSTDVEDTYVAEVNNVEDVFEINTDVEDTYVAEVSADIEDVYIAEINDVEDSFAEVNADVNDIENSDSEIEQILSCENLDEAPACLGEDYATLVSSGLEVSTAIDLEYVGVTTDQNVDNPTMIVSGNPCTLPGYFVEESCIDYITSIQPGKSTIKLVDEENIEVRGGLLERVAALAVLANGEAQGTECVVTGTDPNTAVINCNEQLEE
jgi:hypothetical protein